MQDHVYCIAVDILSLVTQICDPHSVLDYIKSRLLTTVPFAQKKVRAHSKIRNIIPYELHLFEQKNRIEDIENMPTKSSRLIWAILLLLGMNAMKN